MLLQTKQPYTLLRGLYELQIRFTGDPKSDREPFTVPLISDLDHNELRTKNPIDFSQFDLPSVINSLEYRIFHNTNGQFSEWTNLDKSVILLPDLQDMTCSTRLSSWLVSGKNLNLIESIRVEDNGHEEDFQAAQLVSCLQGLCLRIPNLIAKSSISIRIRWVDNRIFNVHLPKLSKSCEKLPY